MTEHQEYWDVQVIIDGALERQETVYSEKEVKLLAEDEELNARDHGRLTEVFVIHHAHPEPGPDDDDCGCVEYLTDHFPEYTFNGPEREYEDWKDA